MVTQNPKKLQNYPIYVTIYVEFCILRGVNMVAKNEIYGANTNYLTYLWNAILYEVELKNENLAKQLQECFYPVAIGENGLIILQQKSDWGTAIKRNIQDFKELKKAASVVMNKSVEINVTRAFWTRAVYNYNADKTQKTINKIVRFERCKCVIYSEPKPLLKNEFFAMLKNVTNISQRKRLNENEMMNKSTDTTTQSSFVFTPNKGEDFTDSEFTEGFCELWLDHKTHKLMPIKHLKSTRNDTKTELFLVKTLLVNIASVWGWEVLKKTMLKYTLVAMFDVNYKENTARIIIKSICETQAELLKIAGEMIKDIIISAFLVDDVILTIEVL